MSGVQVAEEGNKRKGAMNAAEVEQCAGDIVDWFVRKAELEKVSMPSRELQALEKALDATIPESFKVLLEVQDGGIWFNEYKGLSSKELIDQIDTFSSYSGWKNDSYIPFASDVDGALLIIDNSDLNAVYEYDQDSGRGDSVLADSFSEYLEKFRDQLLSGRFEFIQEVGIVERARK